MATPTSRGVWYYLWPFANEWYHLRTRLTPEQCREQLRLHVAANPGGRVASPTYDAVTGWISPLGFQIQRDDNLFVTPCPMVVSGKIVRTDDGSRLTIRVRTEGTGLTIVSLWLLVWSIFLLIDLLTSFASPHSGLPNFLFWICWFLGYGILVLSRWVGRDDGRILVRFLCEVLKAEQEAIGGNPANSMLVDAAAGWGKPK